MTTVSTTTAGILDPVTEDDLTLLWAVAANRCPRWLRLTRSGVPPRSQFGDRLWDQVLAHFVVRISGEPLAYLCVNRADLLGRTAWVEAVEISDIDDGSPVWMQIEEAFLAHVFSTWSLRFLLSEHLDGGPPHFSRATPIGRERAAVLHQGEWRDTIVSTIGPAG